MPFPKSILIVLLLAMPAAAQFSRNQVRNDAYGPAWNGDRTRAPNADAVHDQFVALAAVGLDPNIVAIAGEDPTNGQQIVWTGPGAVTVYDSSAWWRNLANSGSLATWLNSAAGTGPIQFGTGAASNSTDPQFLVTRVVGAGTAGNGHCFSDSSDIDRAGTIGYNSYDARVDYIGTNDYDHYAAFQADPSYGSSGTISNIYGLYTRLRQSAGTVGYYYHIYCADPVRTGGTLTTIYGLYVPTQTAATNNYGVYIQGNESYFGALTRARITSAGATTIPFRVENVSSDLNTGVGIGLQAVAGSAYTGKVVSRRVGSSLYELDVETYNASGELVGGRWEADGDYITGRVRSSYGGVADQTSYAEFAADAVGNVEVTSSGGGKLVVGTDGTVMCSALSIGAGMGSPVAWWKLDDNAANTTVADAGGSGYDLTAAANTSTKTTAGQIGTALTFNGSSDYAIRNAATLNDTAGSFAAWIKPSAIGTSDYIVSSSDEASTSRYWGIGLSTAGNLFYVQVNNDTADNANGSEVLTAGEWYHVAGTSDGSAVALYVNGAPQTLTWASGSNTGDWLLETTARDNFAIGFRRRTSDGGYFHGDIDDVRMYSTALTAQQVKYAYCFPAESFDGSMAFDGLPVTIGVNDSGGAGFRVLRVPN